MKYKNGAELIDVEVTQLTKLIKFAENEVVRLEKGLKDKQTEVTDLKESRATLRLDKDKLSKSPEVKVKEVKKTTPQWTTQLGPTIEREVPIELQKKGELPNG